jgi:hypothetical protein
MSGVLTIEGVTLAIDGLRHMRIPMLTATVVLSTVACSSEAPTSVVKQATFSYTCCASADIDRVYHPGDVMTVHWIVQNEAPTSATQSTQIDLSAKLSGPYADVSSLKQREIGATSIAAATSISAAPIVTSDWAGGAPTSKLLIPATAAPGFYNLSTTVKSGGFTGGGDGIVRVVAPGHT